MERESKVSYRWDRDTADQETMNYLEFSAQSGNSRRPGKFLYPSMIYRWLQQSFPCMRVFVRIMRILGLNPSADAKSA